MKAAKKRPRNANPRKPAAKKPVRKVATRKAAPKRPAAPKPRARRAVQRRLMIRFTDPSDADWLGAQGERMGLGGAKGAGAATYARMLIRAARECMGDPIDTLRQQTVRPLPPHGATQQQRIERAINPPVVAPAAPQEPEGEPVDVDGLVDEVVSKVQDDRGPPPDDEPEHRGGGVRVFGVRQTRRPVDWSGR